MHIGARVLICRSCNGLMTDEKNPLTVNARGAVSLEGRTIAIACDSCHTILDITPEMLGNLATCPRCREKFLVPVPRPIVFTRDGSQEPSPVQALENANRPSSADSQQTASPSWSSTAAKRGLTNSKRTFRRPDEAQWAPDLAESPPFPSLPKNEDASPQIAGQIREDIRRKPSSPIQTESAASNSSSESLQVSDLRRVYLFRSWRTSKITLPHFLLRGRGRMLESILRCYINALHREQLPGVEVAFAGELQNVPDVNRPLRVLHRIRMGHMGVTDILFRSEGNDLYVRFQSNPRTWINYLQMTVYATLFLLFYSLFLLIYLNGTGAYQGWVTDYATKYARQIFAGEDRAALYGAMITHGYYEFDNDAFVKSMADEDGKKMLAAFADKMARNTYHISLEDEKIDANEAHPELEMFDNRLRRLRILGYDAFGYSSSDTLASKHSDNDYIVWYNPDRPLFNWDKQLYGYKTIQILEGAKNTLRSSYLSYPELRQLPELSKRMTAAYDRSLRFHRPWSIAKLFFSDPKLAVMSMGGPSALFGLLIGCGLYFLPLSVLSIPCRFLGWPTPDEFQNTVQSRNAWTERVLSDILFHEFGVQEGDRFAILSQ